MQINGLLEHDINSAPDAAAPKSASGDAVQQTEAVVEDPQGDPLSTEIDRHVGLDSSNQRTFETNSKGETGDPLDRVQTCISARLAGLNAVLSTAEQEFGRAGPRGSEPVLMYGPPRVRDQGRPMQPESAAPLVEWPWQRFATVRVERSLVEMPRRLPLRRLSSIPPASGAGALVEAPLRLTLEPESISEPPQLTKGRGFWRVMLHAGGVLGFTAFVVWVVVSIPSARLGHETMQSRFSGAPIPPDLSTQAAVPAAVPAPSERPDAQVAVSDRPTPEHKDQRDSVGSAAVPSPSAPIVSTPTRAAITKQPPPAVIARETPPAAQPAPQLQPTIQPMAQDLTARQIDPDELASLVRRGDDFVNFRDLSSARLLYRRAAEGGNVHAALALAGTFDPNVLKKLGFPENVGEVTKARLWYERAQQLGSAEAPQRLQQLATVTNSGK